jgi:hypothetical protein
MAKTVTVGWCFGEKYFDGEKGRFCGGFCDFLVFCRGRNVVSCGGMRGYCGVLCAVFWGAKLCQLLRFTFVRSRFGNLP